MPPQQTVEPTPQHPGYVTQSVGDETLVYDERTHQAFCLNPVAAQVWRHLDGIRTPTQIAILASDALGAPISEEAVLVAIAELRRNGLIEPDSLPVAAPIPTRRDLLRQLGAGAVVMLPVVVAIMAPKAAQAYNGCVNCNAQPARPIQQTAPAKVSPSRGLYYIAPADSSDSGDENKKRRQREGEIFVP